MEPRRIVTPAQANALVRYLEENGDLILGKDRSVEGRAQSRRAWNECAEVVNRVGDPRSGREWAKYWCEIKCRVRTKLAAGAKSLNPLSPLEERVAAFVTQNIRSDAYSQEMENKEEESEAKEEVPLPYKSPSSSSPAAPAEQSPRKISPRPSAPRTRGRAMTWATQYSPSAVLHSMMAHSEERRARLEERSARLEERRARTEERRIRTEQLLAEAVMQRAEAAVMQAEAARTQAQALTNISQAFQHFVDLASLFMSQPNRY